MRKIKIGLDRSSLAKEYKWAFCFAPLLVETKICSSDFFGYVFRRRGRIYLVFFFIYISLLLLLLFKSISFFLCYKYIRFSCCIIRCFDEFLTKPMMIRLIFLRVWTIGLNLMHLGRIYEDILVIIIYNINRLNVYVRKDPRDWLIRFEDKIAYSLLHIT